MTEKENLREPYQSPYPVKAVAPMRPRDTSPSSNLVFRVSDVREAWHYLKQARAMKPGHYRDMCVQLRAEALEQLLDEL